MLGSILGEINKFVNKHDDDSIDRCSHRYTVMILAVFVFLIASKQYFGEPIVCWTPATFTGTHNSYTNAICWTHGTYPVASDQLYHTVDRTNVLPYYQWVPFILLFQSLCFCLPHILWNTLSRQTGIDVGSLIKNAISADNMDSEKRAKVVDQIADHIRISLTSRYEYEPLFKRFNIRKRLPFGKRHGNYLYVIYLFIKATYIANVFLQLFLMNFFFAFQYHSYGLDFLRKFLQGDDYSRINMAFPRITFCDIKIRNIADNMHTHSVQCALPINLFNEKFFICLWFWLIVLAFMTIWNFIKWIFMSLPMKRKSTIEKYLKAKQRYGGSEKDRLILSSFVNEYVHLDGAFMFNLIRRNTNFITTSEIIASVWDKFYRAYTSTQEMKGSLECKRRNVDEIDIAIESTPLNSDNLA